MNKMLLYSYSLCKKQDQVNYIELSFELYEKDKTAKFILISAILDDRTN